MKTRRFRINNFRVTSDLGEFVRFYRVLEDIFHHGTKCLFHFSGSILKWLNSIWVQNRIFIVVYPVARRRERSIRKGIELDFLACLLQWLVKIRQDAGPHFKPSGTTKVCSLHFYESDIKKGIGGKKMALNEGACPSRFPWRTSPRKRPPPTVRTCECPAMNYMPIWLTPTNSFPCTCKSNSFSYKRFGRKIPRWQKIMDKETLIYELAQRRLWLYTFLTFFFV